ncbi:MAG TPA: hypothetical protein VFY23_10160 [Candidatus Limnocylindrales bacterium]|nr:hypothetical protein [Candidatus Limnocylindrales bacterium]
MPARAILPGSVLALVVVLAAAALGLVSLDPPEPSMTTDGLPILVGPPPPRGMQPVLACPPAGLAGTLRRDARTGLTIDGYTLVWPHDYSATLDGDVAVLLDDRGDPVAREGDVIRVAGGFATPGGLFDVCGAPAVLDTAAPAPTP